MKKFYYLPIALVAVALTACSSDDDVSVKNGGKYGDQIVFATSIASPATRAYTDAASITTYKVAAIDQSNNVYFDYLAPTAPAAGETEWTSGKLWIDGTLKFFAYAPTDVSATAATAASQTIEFTQNTDASNATHYDLITAYNSGTRSSNPVNLDFKHALSKIVLKATNGNATDYEVKVTGAKLAFVKNAGTLTFQTNPAAVTGSSDYAADKYPTWATSGSETAYTTTCTANVLTSAASSIGQDLYIVPQTASSIWDGDASATAITTGAYLAVNCTITRNSDSQVIYTGYSAVKFASAPTWAPGKAYTYTINFFTGGGGGGQVDPIQAPDGGEDIIAPITFTVSISDWVDGGSTDIDAK